jgi:hypothetical protein
MEKIIKSEVSQLVLFSTQHRDDQVKENEMGRGIH